MSVQETTIFGKLRRAFSTGQTPPVTTRSPTQAITESELNNLRFITAGVERRASWATDYRNSAERIRSDLISAQEKLEQAIHDVESTHIANAIAQKEYDLALFIIARIRTALGDYEEAENIYTQLCHIPLGFGHLPGHSTLVNLLDYEVEISLNFLEFLSKTGRNLELAENLALEFLQQLYQRPPGAQREEEGYHSLLSLVRLYNRQNDYEKAMKWIVSLHARALILPSANISIAFSLEYAIALSRKEEHRAQSLQKFVCALVDSAVLFGMWNSNTLDIMYYFGVALRDWGDHKGASTLLGQCSLGSQYRLGETHPDSKLAFNELGKCNGSHEYLTAIQELRDADTEEAKLAVAYGSIYINTVIDLVISIDETPFEEIEASLRAILDEKKPLKVESPDHRAVFILRAHRNLARCMFAQGKVAEAISSIQDLTLSVKRSLEGSIQSDLDLAMFYASNADTKPKAIELSREIFFMVDEKLTREKVRAFRHKLSELGLTHFPWETIENDPLPIKVVGNVGSGAYAIVESIKISGRLYARKSIALPRYNQNRIRQTIQNEVSVIRALSHPHIVQVYCTYEEKTRFAIVLQPLASCDLEAFLETHTQPSLLVTKMMERQLLIWKWFRCLANTLSFIHSKGIRHKDIKTRNILVNGDEIIFADFGSSHAFLDEGTSVTEGPAFGHTAMYCAPEVISWEKRSRSADIFSLGCVYTEMASALDGRKISDYFEFRARASETSAGGETHAYHATLDLVEEWFTVPECSPGIKHVFTDVIKPMLKHNPDHRPTASMTSHRIQCIHLTEHTGYTHVTCSYCLPED